jgi:hypothetical protein
VNSEPLTNGQGELLRFFFRNLTPEDLLDLKRILVRFLAQKATEAANKTMEERNWTAEDIGMLAPSMTLQCASDLHLKFQGNQQRKLFSTFICNSNLCD